MRLLLIAAAVATACSGDSSGSGKKKDSSGASKPGKFVQLSLEMLPGSKEGEVDAGGLVEITLVLTDETGSTRRISLGEYPGPCEDATVAEMKSPMKPLLGARCTGGEGLRLRLVQRNRSVVLWKAPGLQGDEFDYDEFHEYEMPAGTAITVEQR